MNSVLVIGGYGNFGRLISARLAKVKDLQVIVAGRSLDKARALASQISTETLAVCCEIDANKDISPVLARYKPSIVIHTSGPYQSRSYDIARACIKHGCHYIDLADSREFVANIEKLDNAAKAANVSVISGASSLPALSSAIVEHFQETFSVVEELDYGIATAQRTPRGLATLQSILSYTGRSITTLRDGVIKETYGWQGLRQRSYTSIGKRFLSDCDVPDLALFPAHYPALRSIRFSAGLEIPLVHLSLWLLSWPVRWGWVKSIVGLGPLLLKLSYFFDRLGSENSAFHMDLKGKGLDGEQRTVTFEILARSGDGLQIPAVPAALVAKKILDGTLSKPGAYPCIGLVSLDQYLKALEPFDISWTAIAP